MCVSFLKDTNLIIVGRTGEEDTNDLTGLTGGEGVGHCLGGLEDHFIVGQGDLECVVYVGGGGLFFCDIVFCGKECRGAAVAVAR